VNLEEQVSRIVRQVVEEYRAQLTGSAPTSPESLPPRQVLVLHGEERFRSFVSAINETLSLLQIACRTMELLRDADRASGLEAIQAAHIVVAPAVTLSQLARFAQLDDTEPLGETLIEALLAGKDVVVGTSHALPQGTDRLKVPPGVAERVADYVQQIAQFGVKVTPAGRLPQLVKSLAQQPIRPSRMLVHAAHVRDWASEGAKRIRLPQGTLLTSLAKEEAKDRGLRLDFEI